MKYKPLELTNGNSGAAGSASAKLDHSSFVVARRPYSSDLGGLKYNI